MLPKVLLLISYVKFKQRRAEGAIIFNSSRSVIGDMTHYFIKLCYIT
jgi:hypothetical protein